VIPKKHNLKLISCLPIAKDTYQARFDIKDTDFDFRAGQYITVTPTGLEHLDIREQFRDFSISSPPSQKDFIAISFRRSDSIFKKRLMSLQKGTKVLIEGPAGIFALPDEPVIMVAGGIGVTPFFSMIENQKEAGSRQDIKLICFNSDEESVPFKQELESNDMIETAFIYGPVTEEVLAPYLSDDYAWLIAGPPAMVDATRNCLRRLGVKGDRIKAEEFSGYDWTNDTNNKN
jgi:ferredoxin-NADP reductase